MPYNPQLASIQFQKEIAVLKKENEELYKENKKGEITCSCQLGFKCEGNFSHPSMICCSYSSDPQTKIIWDYKKQNEELKQHLDIIHKELWSYDGEYDGKVSESVKRIKYLLAAS
tara:strand:- start:469 stop:813 length:345 start_codon:yes stop_codon:yes gene_type:complete